MHILGISNGYNSISALLIANWSMLKIAFQWRIRITLLPIFHSKTNDGVWHMVPI